MLRVTEKSIAVNHKGEVYRYWLENGDFELGVFTYEELQGLKRQIEFVEYHKKLRDEDNVSQA